MHDYPESAAAIVSDYLDRLQARLKPLQAGEREDFVREIRSHIHEAYQNEPEADEVVRMLKVLRRLGEPSEVVAERLPRSVLQTARSRRMPVYILGGILIAIFGIPLGFGGVAVLIGILAALTGALVGYYAAAISLVFIGTLGSLLGLLRLARPDIWDDLIQRGIIQMNGEAAGFLNLFAPDVQGILLITIFALLAMVGLAMLWLGRYLFRGLRFLFLLMLDWVGKLGRKAPSLLQKLRGEGKRDPLPSDFLIKPLQK